MRIYPLVLSSLLIQCNYSAPLSLYAPETNHSFAVEENLQTAVFDKDSWPYFLQHLPVVDSMVVDYRGVPVADQYKQAGIIPYDVGEKDLQQCADAIMRLRAEYLFQQNRIPEIAFHFTSGQLYSFDDYCKGKRPLTRGNQVSFVYREACGKSHTALRRYLDIVYTYAGTISLAKELKKARGFSVGTVVIYPGSPGHCFIIIDEAINSEGKKVFRLAEGYTPAQSIYVLRNMEGEGKDPWHALSAGMIETASYRFEDYQLGSFE
ncbi:MAG: DUF4846 domain-containing protein [Flavisolibacter sp.]